MSAPTDCIGSSNTSGRGNDFQVTMRSKGSAVPRTRSECARTEGTPNTWLILPLKTLIRKRVSRCLLFKWSCKKFNLTKMSWYLYSHPPLKNLVHHKAANFFWILFSLNESVIIIEFQATGADSVLKLIGLLYKTFKAIRSGKGRCDVSNQTRWSWWWWLLL